MPILDELALYLQTAGVGTIGTSLFKGSIPQDAPTVVIQDELVVLLETPGLPPVHSHTQQEPTYEQPTVQVVTRGAPYSYATARARAETAFEALTGLANQSLDGVTYLWIQALQSPFLLRIDDFGRPIIAFQVRCLKEV